MLDDELLPPSESEPLPPPPAPVDDDPVPPETVPPLEFDRDHASLLWGIGLIAGAAVVVLLAFFIGSLVGDPGLTAIVGLLAAVAVVVLPIIGIVRLTKARRRPVPRDVRNPFVQRALDDAAWDPTGYTLTGWERSLRWLRAQSLWLVVGAVGSLVLGGALSVAADSPALFLLPPALPVTWIAVRFALMTWFGDTRITFTQFPYELGEPVRLLFRPEGASGIFHDVEFRLRYVGLDETGRWTSSRDVPYQVWLTETWELPAPGSDVEVVLTPSAHHGIGSAFSRSPSSEWYVEVRGRTRAGRFEELFPVPIYTRPVEG